MTAATKSLYKEILKCIRRYPGTVSHRRKLARDAREIFDIHKGEASEERIAKLIRGGYQDLEVIKALASINASEDGLIHKLAGNNLHPTDINVPAQLGVEGWRVKDFAWGFNMNKHLVQS
ncbi:hypothetical protein HDU97_010103 [Phlyctochytrium planicorne]|nr:hypothetical protein HDU97_010103 [Phlyctochytrium planicorne]